MLLYLTHTPCPTSDENMLEVKARSTSSLLPLHSAEWKDLIERYPHESPDNMSDLGAEVNKKKLLLVSQPGSYQVAQCSLSYKLL